MPYVFQDYRQYCSTLKIINPVVTLTTTPRKTTLSTLVKIKYRSGNIATSGVREHESKHYTV